MVSSSEKRKLIERYGEPVNARAVIARAVAGLLAIAVIAVVGLTYAESDTAPAGITASRAVSGR